MQIMNFHGLPLLYSVAPEGLVRGHAVQLGGHSTVFAEITVPGAFIAQTGFLRAPKGLDAVVRDYVAQGCREALQRKMEETALAKIHGELLSSVRAADPGALPQDRTFHGNTVPTSPHSSAPWWSNRKAQRPDAEPTRPQPTDPSLYHLGTHPWAQKIDFELRKLIAREIVPCADEMLAALTWDDADAYERVAQDSAASNRVFSFKLPRWVDRPRAARMVMITTLLHGIWCAHHLSQDMPDDPAGLSEQLRMTHDFIVSLLVSLGLSLDPMSPVVHETLAKCLKSTGAAWEEIGAMTYAQLSIIAQVIVYNPAETPTRNPRGVGLSPADVTVAARVRDNIAAARASDAEQYAESLVCPAGTYRVVGIRSDNCRSSISWDEAMASMAEAFYPLAWAIEQARNNERVTHYVGDDNDNKPAWSAGIAEMTARLTALLLRRLGSTTEEGYPAAILSVIDQACVWWLAATALDVQGDDRPYTDIDHGLFASQALVSYWALVLSMRYGLIGRVNMHIARGMNLRDATWLDEPFIRDDNFRHHTGVPGGPGSARGLALCRVISRGHGGDVDVVVVDRYLRETLEASFTIIQRGLDNLGEGNRKKMPTLTGASNDYRLALRQASDLEDVLFPKKKKKDQ